MAIQDITFLLFIGISALAFTIVVFVWRGVLWIGLVAGVMWLLLAFFFNIRTQEGTAIMEFQEYLSIIFIGVGIAMVFSPMWLRAKQMDIERNAPDDIDIWGDDIKDYNRKRIDAMIAERKRR